MERGLNNTWINGGLLYSPPFDFGSVIPINEQGTKDQSGSSSSSSTSHPLDNISGLALWLDASNIDGDNNSSLSDGDAVSEWLNLADNLTLNKSGSE